MKHLTSDTPKGSVRSDVILTLSLKVSDVTSVLNWLLWIYKIY